MFKVKSEYDDLDKYQHSDGDILYYKKDTHIYHNPYGPAIIDKYGIKEYWVEDNLHRLDGPAIIYPDGQEIYVINNKQLNKEEFEKHPERLKFLDKEYLLCLR